MKNTLTKDFLVAGTFIMGGYLVMCGFALFVS